MRERFDVNSKLTEVANAVRESEARQAQLNAELREEVECYKHLLRILGQRFGAGFPGPSGEDILRKIEANVKRSASRVVADKKRQNRAESDARTAAIDKARIVIDKYQMNELTASMIQHIDDAVAKVYRERTHSRSRR
jgi:hypothetical protein